MTARARKIRENHRSSPDLKVVVAKRKMFLVVDRNIALATRWTPWLAADPSVLQGLDMCCNLKVKGKFI